jgi:RHS repeat-associated protein
MEARSDNATRGAASVCSASATEQQRSPPKDALEKAGSNPLPTVNLPKGGGAIRGIGEKFTVNPVVGTGSMSVPIATSPGRSGFGPQLTLSYDSGAGNGPFGFGWRLSPPSITRKTDKGLPAYGDAAESDVFIFSGAEDLVPEFEKDARGDWVLRDGKRVVHDQQRTVNGVTYHVRRYRPRIEGLFARLERWTNSADPADTFWRSTSKDNITTWYGRSPESRIVDPHDATHIFSWLICQSHDDKGNVMVYGYKAEDSCGVDTTRAHERNRTAPPGLPDPRAANRYLKRIRYGNRTPFFPDYAADGAAAALPADWLFEVVFDYGEHDAGAPRPEDGGPWTCRLDPFSTYRAGFEIRTYRLCQRVLMFHHFPDLPTGERGCDGLVRSTDFEYSYEKDPEDSRNAIYSFLLSVTQAGYQRAGGGYLQRCLPPVEFTYSQPIMQDTVEEVDAASLENLPIGLDGTAYQWIDLHGEGIPGILTEQAGAWFYKRNISPLPGRDHGTEHLAARFAPVELVATRPTVSLAGGQAQFMDLAGDGQPDLVVLDGPMPGFYEHDDAEGWQPFRPFTSRLNRRMRDPNVKLVDLDGDGHADVLITENDAFVWHPSRAEQGFGPARRVMQAWDEERGPRLVFADDSQSIHLADLSGDGLTDLVRIRNGEICYWPNLGYGRFGAKVSMDNAPWFDHCDQFDPRRVRLADIDGSGTTDIIYLARDGVHLYFNQSGNSWSKSCHLGQFPQVDNLSSVMAVDLFGNGTACLVWSSPLPGDACRPMRYIDLMGGQKPHLLVQTVNNLGAETHVHYAPSTRFYLQDKQAGKPWITRLPFPVHVVERVETYDRISRSRFVTRRAYHHGYFDGEEREFQGFGMVEQWDTEELAALTCRGAQPEAVNVDVAFHVPPVHTRTWFHTGIYRGRERVSRQFESEYYRGPGLNDQQWQAQLLPDTILPAGLTWEEEHEACRALKGMMLRQEVYADDAPAGASAALVERAGRPYTVVEQNFTIRVLQARGDNRHAVFFTHPREAVTYHYERRLAPILDGQIVDEAAAADPHTQWCPDPRVQHTLTLEVDDFGNVRKEAAIGYGRRPPDATLVLQADRDKQTQTLITYTENRVTNAIDSGDDYRTPLPCETRTYELTGLAPENHAARFSLEEWTRDDFALPVSTPEISYEQTADNVSRQRRLVEHVRTLYRKDDLAALLPLGEVASLALPGEVYKLAFTPGLLAQVLRRDGQSLLPSPAGVLGGQGGDRGGYLSSQVLRNATLFPADDRHPFWTASDADDHWWIPAGRVYFHPDGHAAASQERDEAGKHFYLARRFDDPFGVSATIRYDVHDLLAWESEDALQNKVTVGERGQDPEGHATITNGNDYRVLQPALVTDANGNRSAVAFDALGMVAGTALRGKRGETLGDSLEDFTADLTDAEVLAHLANPLAGPHAILACATTRLVYDLFAYQRTKGRPDPQPAVVYALARETHSADLQPGQQTKFRHNFNYSDGLGREIQKKIQAEPEKVNGVVGPPRWVGSGWTIFNNKGKPVRRYEPFFSATHAFEFGVEAGVSAILFYDPLERVIATLHPNHTYEKVVFDPWQQTTWDVNDTVRDDPRTDSDIRGYVAGYFSGLPAGPTASPWETWHNQRQGATLGAQEQAAAVKAAAHADTPTRAWFDALRRPFLTVAHNKVVCPHHDLDGTEKKYPTRVELDIEGNQRAVIDAQGRIVMRYAYDMLSNCIYQLSMEAGARWMVNDVIGKPIRAWDSRGHRFRTEYDPLRRSLRSFVTGADPDNPTQELLTERLVYGEQHPEADGRNLRGKLYLHLDQAGAVTREANDFKGNLLRAARRIAREYQRAIDWKTVDAAVPADPAAALVPATLEAALVLLVEGEDQAYTSRTAYDALSRPIVLTTPHTPAMRPNVIRPGYNEANLLERVDANLRSATANGQPVWTAFVVNIDYNAKGQRQRIDYGNGASTLYEYDPLTFRLVHLLTRRDAVVFPDDWPQPPPAGWPGGQVQNLHYTYDPAGNITHIRDDAQQTVYFRNKRVEPSADYTYDAAYRLIEASGREHLGQGGVPIPHSPDDSFRSRLPHPGDGNALGTYIERYVYDAVGNFLEMRHCGSDPAHAGWTRSYSYNEASLIEPAQPSNRLSRTSIGNGSPLTERYVYDAHGNMVRMPHLGGVDPASNMHWDYKDRLRRTDLGGGGTAYYTYDAAGQRVRKVWEKSANLVEERLYLGGFEIYRQRDNAGTVMRERETLHIMDDKQRIALVETRTLGDEPGVPGRLIRYQFANHLGSASLELDDQAQIISYEEYTPYGGTSYQAVRSRTETPKRYRYTGKERDEESGLYYHGARYYAPWLGRWASCDPPGLVDGVDLYNYAGNNPLAITDPTGTQGVWNEEQQVCRPEEFGDEDTAISVPGTPTGVSVVPQRQPRPPARPSASSTEQHTQEQQTPRWYQEVGFNYQTGRHSPFQPVASVNTGYGPVADFAWAFVNTLNNLASIPVNAAFEAAALPEEGMRALGASEEDIQALNFTLMMTGIGEVSALGALGAERSAMSGLTRAETALSEAAPLVETAARTETAVARAAPLVAEAAPLVTDVTTIETTNARLQSLLRVAESGEVNWLAGDARLYQAYESAMATRRSTAAGREGFNLLRARLSSRLTLEGPIHHWRFPITQYSNEALSAENLYLTEGSAHLSLHQAVGLQGAPYRSMAWGAEPELQSMFNFWLSSGPK